MRADHHHGRNGDRNQPFVEQWELILTQCLARGLKRDLLVPGRSTRN